MNRPSLIYAGRLERLFANLIDTLILLVPAGIIAGLMSHMDNQNQPVLAPSSMLIIFLLNAAYFTIFTGGRWQATPGKRLLNMHVVRTDQKKLEQRDALERFLAYVMPSLPIYASFLPENFGPILVVWLSIFWFAPILTTPERAGIHDRLCRTRVVAGRL